MKVGILSDSHDNLQAIRKVVEKLNSENVDYVFHAGDIVSPFSAKELLKLKSFLFVTFGNNDGEKLLLKEVLTTEKSKVIWPKASIEVNGYKVAMLHGEDEELVEAIARSGVYDVVIYGHWHKVVNKIIGGKTLLVNPGELCGYLTGSSTYALVDLETKEVKIVSL